MKLTILPKFGESATYSRTQAWVGSVGVIVLATFMIGLGLAAVESPIVLALLTAGIIYLSVWKVSIYMGRARDLGLNGAWGLIMLVPYVALVGLIIGGFFPTGYFRKD